MTQTSRNTTETDLSINQVDALAPSRYKPLSDLDNKEEAMMRILSYEFNIQKGLGQYLTPLRNFEIVIVCDDSGSMATPVENTGKTRWEALCDIVKRMLGICVMFDTSGVDLYFLNGDKCRRVRNPVEVDHAFARSPSGYTPLVRVLQKIFQSRMARRGDDKKLLVVVATDGRPTNDHGEEVSHELEQLMRDVRDAKTTYVSFLLCTDEPECIDYLARWDRTMINVDVTDDYETELAKIRRCQEDENFVFTEDDYIMKALIGAIVPNVDRLNEMKARKNID